MLNPAPIIQELCHRSCTLCLSRCLHDLLLVLHLTQLEALAVQVGDSRSNGCTDVHGV